MQNFELICMTVYKNTGFQTKQLTRYGDVDCVNKLSVDFWNTPHTIIFLFAFKNVIYSLLNFLRMLTLKRAMCISCSLTRTFFDVLEKYKQMENFYWMRFLKVAETKTNNSNVVLNKLFTLLDENM